MMDGREKSDGRVLPVKLPNNAQGGAAEVVEGRRPAKGNAAGKTRSGPSAGQGALSELGRVRRVAATDKEARFTALLRHVDVDRLRAAYFALRPKAAPGVDGIRWHEYGLDLEANLLDLHRRVAVAQRALDDGVGEAVDLEEDEGRHAGLDGVPAPALVAAHRRCGSGTRRRRSRGGS